MRLLVLLLLVAVPTVILATTIAGNGDEPATPEESDPAGPGRLRIEVGGDPPQGGDPVPPRRNGEIESGRNGGGKPDTPPREPTRHLVKRGDTLRGLAREYYGDPERWTEIRDANPTIEGETIVEGTVIVIP